MADRIKGITIEIGGDATKLSSALNDVNKKTKETQKQLNDVNKLLKLDPTNTTLLDQKMRLLGTQIGTTKDKLDKLKSAQTEMDEGLKTGKVTQEQYDAYQREIIETEQQLKSLEEQQKQCDSAVSASLKAVGSKLEEVGGKVKDVGDSLTKNVTAPIAAVGTASMAAWAQVDDGLDTIVKKTGASGEALKDMQQRAKNLATSIPTDFSTAGDAIGEVNTRFGLTGDALEELSGQFIKFADLNDTDVSSSIDSVQKAMSAFGLESDSAGAMLDMLNKVGQDTGISVDTLASSLVTNGSALREMGFSASDSATLLGNLEKAGVDTSLVMTGLSKAQAESAESGKSMSDVLTEAFSSSGDAADIFGTKAGPKLYEAMQSGIISMDDFVAGTTNMDDNLGNVSDTFEETQDPIDKWKTTLNELMIVGSDLGTSLQDVLIPIIEKLSDKASEFSEWYTSLSPEMQDMIVKIALIAAALGPVLSIVGTLISTVGSLVSIFGAISGVVAGAGGAMALFTGPVGIAVALIAQAVLAGVLLYQNWDTIKEKASELWNKITETFSGIKESISGKMDEAKQKASDAWDNMKTTASTKAGEIRDKVGEKFGEIKGKIGEKMEDARTKFDEGLGKLKGMLNFDWSLPKLKAPHFKVSGGEAPWGFGGKGSLPSVSVDWYAKAMDKGMILTQPTIFGYSNGNLLAGGEAGAEAVVGVSSLEGMIQNAVNNSSGGRAINFTQNNYSPEALDKLTIYRNTRSALAQIR